MEFQRERVYTAVNADELRVGDKVCVADTLMGLENRVRHECVAELEEVLPDYNEHRFKAYLGIHNLAYLVERKENCTNCGNRGNSYCSCFTRDKSDDELSRTVCGNYIRLSEQKAEKNCNHCEEARKSCAMTNACPNKHYRPFRDVDELIEEWDKKLNYRDPTGLAMPYIWVERKDKYKSRELITGFTDHAVSLGIEGNSMQDLFNEYEFLDGSPCGVEE